MVHAGSMLMMVHKAEAHKYSLLSRYFLAKSTPMLASMPGVDTCAQAVHECKIGPSQQLSSQA